MMSELASVNIRLFPFAAALAKRGHTTFVSDPDHFHQVHCSRPSPCNCSGNVVLRCKALRNCKGCSHSPASHRLLVAVLALQQGHGISKGCKQHGEHAHRHISDLPQLAPMQVDMDKLDAIIFVKVLEQGFQILQNSSVPLIWDHVDEWDGGSLDLCCSILQGVGSRAGGVLKRGLVRVHHKP